MPVTLVPTLTVDLSAIVTNWRLLCGRHAHRKSAAVVKADAYGLGVVPVAKALHTAGCSTFFVATLEEGITLRQALPQVPIYVFHGVGRDESPEFIRHTLRPVLNSPEQLKIWKEAQIGDKVHPSALHVDTGMSRLGFNETELASAGDWEDNVCEGGIDLLMTHLACASEPEHPLNEEQLARFEVVRSRLPAMPTSVANSAGHFLRAAFHGDMGRPGCALYGITPNASEPNPMHSVAEWKAPVIQLRDTDRDGTVGYGAATPVNKGTRVAVVATGYADGLHRIASHRLCGWVGDTAVPMLGRVSMDMTCFDVSAVPEQQLETEGGITLIGPQQPVDTVAEICHTIGYEIFTRIGSRVRRQYKQGG